MTDPFEMGLFGGLPKTETDLVLRSTGATTVAPKAAGHMASSWARAKALSCVQMSRARSLSGESSSMTADSEASIARSSETKACSNRPSLSDRLTPSLITAGLVKGITPTSIRHMSGQPIRVFAFSKPVGDGADEHGAVSLSLSGGEGRS